MAEFDVNEFALRKGLPSGRFALRGSGFHTLSHHHSFFGYGNASSYIHPTDIRDHPKLRALSQDVRDVMRLKALAEGMLRAAIAAIPIMVGACATDNQDAASCEECRIALDTIHTLSSVGRSAGFSAWVTAARSSATGRYAVVPGGGVGRIFLYSPEGEFVREIGSEGEGPGEYGRISAVAFDAADSLYVLDTGNGRIDIYSPDGALARSVRHTERGREIHVLPSGEILVQGAAVGTRYADYRVRIVDPEDGSQRGIARFRSEYDISDFGFDYFPIAPVSDDRFWLADAFDFRFELHSLEEGLLRDFSVTADWFAPVSVPRSLEGTMDPRPRIDHLEIDDQGRLWGFGGKPVLPPSIPDLNRFGPGSLELLDMFTDHVVTVLDRETGGVITTRVFDLLPLQFLGSRHGIVTDQLESGEVVLRVVRYEVDRGR